MNIKDFENVELTVQKKDVLKKKQTEHFQSNLEDTLEDDHFLFSDIKNSLHQDIPSFSFISSSESSSTAQKKVSNDFNSKGIESSDFSLLNLSHNPLQTVENSSSSFDVSYFDHLSSLPNNSANNNKEVLEEDIFEAFNRPIEDFVKNSTPNNDNGLYFEQKDSLLDFEENNEYKTLQDDMIKQLVNMNFDYSQVIKAIEMTHTKSDINAVISALMTLDFLDNEGKQNAISENDLNSNRKSIHLNKYLHLSSKHLNGASTIFNYGKMRLQKVFQNYDTQSNNFHNPSKVSKWIKHQLVRFNQESLKQRKNSDNNITDEIQILNTKESSDLLEFSLDEPVHQSSSYAAQPFGSFSNDTKIHDQHLENFTYHPEISIRDSSFEPTSNNSFFDNSDFLSSTKTESIEQSDAFNLSSLIDKVNTYRTFASDAFNCGNYSKALQLYTEAIECLPSDNVLRILLLANRSLCYLRIGNVKLSLLDCDNSLKMIGNGRGIGKRITFEKSMNDIWKKVVIRRAQCLQQLERYEEAKNQWEEIICANIGGVMALDAKRYCEKALLSKFISDTSVSDNLKNRSFETMKEPILDIFAQKNTSSISKKTESLKKNYISDALDFENQEKILLYDKVEQRINKWTKGKDDNLRTLISTLEVVLWNDLGWESINMTNLLSIPQVKKAYIKAISKIHPDKLPRNTTIEQKMIASSVFNILNHAWIAFKKYNNI